MERIDGTASRRAESVGVQCVCVGGGSKEAFSAESLLRQGSSQVEELRALECSLHSEQPWFCEEMNIALAHGGK